MGIIYVKQFLYVSLLFGECEVEDAEVVLLGLF